QGIPDPLVRKLQAVVRAAFARRRKTLKNAPVPFLAGGTKEWCDLLSRCGVDPTARAESVPPEKFLALARTLRGIREDGEKETGPPGKRWPRRYRETP
ncbi:MAG TPA: hypothetical protein VJ307_04100, partial [Candidatus Deferrimicrobiaceae bacterium]|nr:hypothetical protein [Candidatus Deferrimicrobiaceae bacterium]